MSMSKETMQILDRFVKHRTGIDVEEMGPRFVSYWDVMSALWTLNDVFRPHISRIQTVKFDDAYAHEADVALKQAAWRGSFKHWEDLPPSVWRVLLERHMQALKVILANLLERDAAEYPVPSKLDTEAAERYLILAWEYGMELPFPVHDESQLELPEGLPAASMKLQ